MGLTDGSIPCPSLTREVVTWFGRSSTLRSVACFSWSCCCADRSARRSSRSSCSGMSWRSCAGSRDEHGSDPSIEQSSQRSHARYRGAPGQVCRCARRRCCAGTAMLRMRAPFVATTPAQLLALEAEHRRDQDRARLIEQPVRLRLPGPEWQRRIETIDDTVPVQEQQPILRTPPRREEKQLQLIGREYLLLVENERDLPVTLSQMASELEHALRAHLQLTRSRIRRWRTAPRPILSGLRRPSDHATLRAFPAFSRNGTTLPEPPPEALTEPLPKTPPRRFRVASSRSSASSLTASTSRSALSGTRRPGSRFNSPLLLTPLPRASTRGSTR